MSTSSLLGINYKTLKGFKRQLKYFHYRYALVRKYLPKFVNKYQKIYTAQLVDFAVLPSAAIFNTCTLQTDFYEFFTEIVCDTPGNTTYAKYLKMTFR